MTMEWSNEQLAAAAVADSYIEILLSTKPELLVTDIRGFNSSDIAKSAQQLVNFRQFLISGLSDQPLPVFEED